MCLAARRGSIFWIALRKPRLSVLIVAALALIVSLLLVPAAMAQAKAEVRSGHQKPASLLIPQKISVLDAASGIHT